MDSRLAQPPLPGLFHTFSKRGWALRPGTLPLNPPDAEASLSKEGACADSLQRLAGARGTSVPLWKRPGRGEVWLPVCAAVAHFYFGISPLQSGFFATCANTVGGGGGSRHLKFNLDVATAGRFYCGQRQGTSCGALKPPSLFFPQQGGGRLGRPLRPGLWARN